MKYTITYTIEADEYNRGRLLRAANRVANDIENSTDSEVCDIEVTSGLPSSVKLFHAAQRSSTTYHEAQGLDFSGDCGRYDPEFDCE